MATIIEAPIVFVKEPPRGSGYSSAKPLADRTKANLDRKIETASRGGSATREAGRALDRIVNGGKSK